MRGTITRIVTSPIEFKGDTVHASKDVPQFEIKSDTSDHIAMHSGTPRTVSPSVAALAYDYAVHANAIIPGVAASLSGLIGPSHVSYGAFTVIVEQGWFGR